MQNKFAIIFGLILGIASGAVMILSNANQTAYGEINWWDEVVAFDDAFDWKEVFGPGETGQNLYALAHGKLLRYPERDAVNEVAANHGLTRDEARAVLQGSIAPLYNTDAVSSNPTQEQALAVMAGMQEQYEFLKEVFELQQELDLYVAPSEIFSNGDLTDSGFDLVHDLAVMEEILFVDVVQNSVGKLFSGQLDKPYLANDGYNTLPTFVAQQTPAAIGSLQSGLEVDGEEGEDEAEGLVVDDGQIVAGEGAIVIGDEVVDVEVLDKDICPVPADELVAALEKYKSDLENGNGVVGVGSGAGGGVSGVDFVNVAGAPLGADGLPIVEDDSGLPDEDLIPAPSDKWRSEWCPGLGIGDGSAVTGSSFGRTGFSSLGGVVNSLVEQSAGALAFAGNEDIALHVAVCLELETIQRTVSSYDPGQGCVLCEIEKINEKMSEALSHSLVPNKATGNLLESAKCKDAYEPFLDMQFIAIASPIPTPSNDDAIYGKNIFEEWNEFVQTFDPLLAPEIDLNYSKKIQSAPAGTTQSELLSSLTNELNRAEAAALQEIENIERSNEATDVTNYLQIVGGEMEAMAEYFNNYNKTFTRTYNICNEIGQKPNLD